MFNYFYENSVYCGKQKTINAASIKYRVTESESIPYTHFDVNGSDANPNNPTSFQGNCVHTASSSHVVWSPHSEPSPYYHLWPVYTIWWRMLFIWWNTCLPQCFPGSNSWQSHCAELTTLMRVRSEVNYPLDKTVISRSRKFTLL